MPRSQFADVVLDPATGLPVTSTQITVYVAVPYAAAPLTTLASINSAETGAGTPGNPFAATTGEINFWAAPGSYDIKIQDTGSPAKFATKVVRWECIPGDQGILGAMVKDGEITSAKILDGTLATSDLAAALSELLVPTGTVLATARSTVPSAAYLMCDGSPASRTTYAALFAAISTSYGVGNGSTTFNVPDLRGRVPVGVDGAAARLTALDALGQAGGEEKHQLTIAEMASHFHTIGYSGIGYAAGVQSGTIPDASPSGTYASGDVGGDTPHNNMQPYQVVSYVIKT